jgi:succinyl-CoA synthetase beta subunit
MKLYEYESADIFSDFGIRVPEKILAATADEVVSAAEKIGFPVVVKAQVLTGGRGLAGGVRAVTTPQEARSAAVELLGSKIQGLDVQSIMVVRKIDFSRELYLGITVDGYNGQPKVMVSTRGGMNIEEVARNNPDDISSLEVNIDRGLFTFEARKLLKTVGFPSKQIQGCADTLIRLYRAFQTYNAMMAEINPMVVCTNGSLMALDAKLEIDDSSLFRTGKLVAKNHERNENLLERLGREIRCRSGHGNHGHHRQETAPGQLPGNRGSHYCRSSLQDDGSHHDKKGPQGGFYQFIRRHQSDSRGCRRGRPLY